MKCKLALLLYYPKPDRLVYYKSIFYKNVDEQSRKNDQGEAYNSCRELLE